MTPGTHSLRMAYWHLVGIPLSSALRHTPDMQRALCTLRDALADAEGRDPEDVQTEAEDIAFQASQMADEILGAEEQSRKPTAPSV